LFGNISFKRLLIRRSVYLVRASSVRNIRTVRASPERASSVANIEFSKKH
jgi:hypothetical protein